MFFFQRGNEKITVLNREDAKNLIVAMSDLENDAPLSTQRIIGTRPNGEQYLCTFGNMKATVLGLSAAETILRWFMTLGADEVSIKRVSKNESTM